MRNLEKIFASAMIIAGTMGGVKLVEEFNISQPNSRLEQCLNKNNQSINACTQESNVVKEDELRAIGLIAATGLVGLWALTYVTKEKE